MNNLKIAVCMLTCILISVCSVAQTSMVASLSRSGQASSTIIRERPGQNHALITCVNDETNTVSFLLNADGQTSLEAKLEGCHVNDMVVTDDSVFFCGFTTGASSVGMIGFFDIDDVFSGTGHIYMKDSFAYDSAHVADFFTGLDVFTNSNNQPCVVCAGRCGGKYPCLVNINLENDSAYSMRHGNSPNLKEKITDVKIIYSNNNKYLVSTGIDEYFGRKTLSMHIYSIDSIFTPEHDDIQFFFWHSSEGARTLEGEEVLVQQINDSIISTISYIHATRTSGPENCNIALSFYNINMMLNGSFHSMVEQIEIPIDDASSMELNEYVWNSATNTLALLCTFTPVATGVKTNLFCELDYPAVGNPGALRVYSHPENLYQGMTVCNNGSQYTMSGFPGAATGQLMYETETFGMSPACANQLTNEYLQPEPMISAKTIISFLTIDSARFATEYTPEISQASLNLECTLEISETAVELDFAVAPNPVRANLSIRMGEDGHYVARLYDMKGVCVNSVEFDGISHMMPINLPKGQYLLRVDSDRGHGVKRVVVM